MKRLIFLLILNCITLISFTQSKLHNLIPGVGFDNFKLTETTLSDIIKYYSNEYKIDTFYTKSIHSTDKTIYSIRYRFERHGVSFYFHANYPTIFAISFYNPFKAKTNLGIILNQSTFKDIVAVYGKKEWTFSGENMMKSYNGITFIQKFKGTLPISQKDLKPYLSNKVTEIIINVYSTGEDL